MSNSGEVEAVHVVSRWAQLTYASFDPGNGARGGWQIKETTGEFTSKELDLLTSRIVTQFDPDTPVAAFPDAEEIAGLPRRLAYSSLGESTAAYWHSVMAGRDSTGRPGNVFSHVVLDRSIDIEVPFIRPIELWRSPSLICPFGTEQVAAAVIRDTSQPTFGATINRQSVLEFIFDPAHWRLGLLSVLVDAVAGATRGGSPVVLVTDSSDSAARWIAAVSFLTSPSVARRINFSVYERANGLKAAMERGVHLICIPRIDAPLATQTPGLIVLDEREMPDLGEVGIGPHFAASGTPIQASYWSVLVQAILVDPATATDALGAVDSISSSIGETGADPSWPLAMHVASQATKFPDHQVEATAVIRASSPDSLTSHDDIYAVAISAVVGSREGSTLETWQDLNVEDVSPILRLALAQKYVLHALSDSGWLSRPHPVELPDSDLGPLSNDNLSDAARSAILAARTNAASSDALDVLFTALRTVVFVDRARLIDFSQNGNQSTIEAVDEILDRALSAVVDSEAASKQMADEVGPVETTGLLDAVLHAIERTERFNRNPPGMRIPVAVGGWLFSARPHLSLPHGLDHPMEPLNLEELIWQCLNKHGTTPVLRNLIIEILAWQQSTGISVPILATLWGISGYWPADDLLEIDYEFPGQVPGHLMLPSLLGEEWSPAVEQLISLVMQGRRNPKAGALERDAAELRNLIHSPWYISQSIAVIQKSGNILDAAQRLLAHDSRCLALPEFADHLAGAALITLSGGKFMPKVPPLVSEFLATWPGPLSPEAAKILSQAVEQSVFDEFRLRELAKVCIETSAGFPGIRGSTGAFAASLIVDTATGPARLIDLPISHAIATGLLTNPRPFLEMSDHEKHVRAWWHSIQPAYAAARDSGARQSIFSALKNVTRKDR
ncbi:GAP1-N2 domain-containing protein [Arthrobacter bambusae]|uniref:Uncharacterized protein n=1 Tax=Arthrobacter bambusae TaxID=1338426 RepID=A0AAW8DCY1_9MICC|nr:hypothetical protein [Arthrobacter bambusae]MDP9905648.1 hypothetical protein [Arthrobacter bambusae]MDQ0127270.1 hypothetical protein [Arthrobacter bambusae]MDQ0178612.1 hypothetical protein [Arthrobacter bambusae]